MIKFFEEVAMEKNIEEALETVELLDEMLESYNLIASDLEKAIRILAIHEKAVEKTILAWKVTTMESLDELKEFTMNAIEISKGLKEEIESMMAYKELFEELFDIMGFELVDAEEEE